MIDKTAIVNQKGGVGKTTTATNLAGCLAEMGKKVLCIDLDPQANLTSSLGFVDNNGYVNIEERTIYEGLTDDSLFLDECIHTKSDTYNKEIDGEISLIPSNINLSSAQMELSGEIGRETILKDKIKDLKLDKDNFNIDYILIDCPPSLGLLTINGLTAANSIIIPITPSPFALDGLNQLIKTYKKIRKKLNQNLSVKGILITRYDKRNSIDKEILQQIKETFTNKVFSTVIRTNVTLKDSQGAYLPINCYEKNSRGYKDYNNLAKEVINNND